MTSPFNIKNIFITTAVLTAFAAIGAALVGITFDQTKADIKENEKLALLRQLNTIIPAESFNSLLL